jgi:ribosomal protein S11
MMARNRRYRKHRTAALGVATAAVLGGGAIAVAAVALAPGGHPAGFVAAPAAHTVRLASQGTMLSTALADWNSSRQGSYAQLAQMTSARGFSQTSHRGKTLDIQRGIVVLATNQFVILQSANGSLHLWLVSGGTKFQNVSGTTAGTAALTASTSATQQAMQSGNMIPATTLLAGSPTTAAAILTPAAEPQTVTVQVAGTDLTVTVTVTRSTAAVTQTATTPANASPVPMTSTFAMNAWQPANSLARGDLAVIAGTRSHQTLHAQLVLFSPLTTSAVGGTTGRGLTKLAAKPSTAPTHW